MGESLTVVISVVALVASVFGIYRGLATLRERKERGSVAHFLRARTAAKENRETFRRNALKLSCKKSAHLTVEDEVPLLV